MCDISSIRNGVHSRTIHTALWESMDIRDPVQYHVLVIPVIRYEQLRTILYLNNGGQLFVRLALVMRERRSAPNWGRVSLHSFV